MNSIKWVSFCSYLYFSPCLFVFGVSRAVSGQRASPLTWTPVFMFRLGVGLVLFRSVCVIGSGCIRPAVFASFHVSVEEQWEFHLTAVVRRSRVQTFSQQCWPFSSEHFLENVNFLFSLCLKTLNWNVGMEFGFFPNKYMGFCLHTELFSECDKIANNIVYS